MGGKQSKQDITPVSMSILVPEEIKNKIEEIKNFINKNNKYSINQYPIDRQKKLYIIDLNNKQINIYNIYK